MKLKPFEYLCLLHPKQDKDGNDDGDTKIIVEKKSVLAKDDKTVAMMATRSIDSQYDNDLDRVEIIVKPF
jgi:hypothetical protein